MLVDPRLSMPVPSHRTLWMSVLYDAAGEKFWSFVDPGWMLDVVSGVERLRNSYVPTDEVQEKDRGVNPITGRAFGASAMPLHQDKLV